MRVRMYFVFAEQGRKAVVINCELYKAIMHKQKPVNSFGVMLNP